MKQSEYAWSCFINLCEKCSLLLQAEIAFAMKEWIAFGYFNCSSNHRNPGIFRYQSTGIDQWIVWKHHWPSCLTSTAVKVKGQGYPAGFSLSCHLLTPKWAASTRRALGVRVSSSSSSFIWVKVNPVTSSEWIWSVCRIVPTVDNQATSFFTVIFAELISSLTSPQYCQSDWMISRIRSWPWNHSSWLQTDAPIPISSISSPEAKSYMNWSSFAMSCSV